MPLTPQDIVSKEFREAFRGYNQSDVDLFLDEVVEEFVRLTDENQKMKVKIAAIQQELARYRSGRAPSAGEAGDGGQIDATVRARVRRFLEEQLRLIDSYEAGGGSPAAERASRELGPREYGGGGRPSVGGPTRPEPRIQHSDTQHEPGPTAAREERSERFWAGE